MTTLLLSDGKKENDLNKLKAEFQNMMIQNGQLTLKGEELFSAIWGNQIGLSQDLFPNLNQQGAKIIFTGMINSRDDAFFKFIKIK